MARGTPRISSGTIPSAGSGNRAALFDRIATEIEAYQSNGEQAWAKTTIATREYVYHSVGDRALGSGSNKGNTDIWLYLKLSTSQIKSDVAMDYSPTSGAWSNAYRRAVSGTSTAFDSISDTAQIDWWACINEHEIYFYYVQSGIRRWAYFGCLIPVYSSRFNGVARITSQSGTGNGVVLGLDRDISANIQPGQYVHLINQTPDSTAIQSVAPNFCAVTAVTANSITVDGVTSTFAVGSICGLDPQSVWETGKDVSASAGYGIMKFDATYVDGNNIGYYTYFPNPGVEGDNDPCFDNHYPMLDLAYYGSATPNQILRGKFSILRICPYGAQADGDIMRIEGDTSQDWRVVVSTDLCPVSNWALCIGPGAT